MELKINGQQVDLPPDAQVALTVQSNDITKPDTVQSSYSNSLTLPFTEKNNRILGNANEVTSLSDVPYAKLEAEVLQDGVEVLANPKAYLLQAGEGYEVDIFSGNLGFFELLGDKSIRELDLSRLDHTWNNANVKASTAPTRTYADGYVYDLINRGIPLYNDQIRPETLQPSVFLRTVYAQIMEEAGVNWQFENELFDKLLLPFSNPKPVYSQAWQDARVYEIAGAVIIASPYMHYGEAELEVSFTVPSVNGESEAAVTFHWGPLNTGLSQMISRIPISKPGDYSLKGAFKVEAYRGNLADLFFNLNAADWNEFTITNIQWKIRYKEEAVYGSDWSIADNLPDIKQKDLFKMVNGLFNLMPSYDPYSNTMFLTPMQELETNKAIAKDWTDKLVTIGNQPTPVQYRFGEFGQQSWFKYKEDELGGSGDAYLTLNDAQLELEKDVLVLPVAASVESLGRLEVPNVKEEQKVMGSEPEGTVRNLAELSTKGGMGLGYLMKVTDASGFNSYANIEKKPIYKGSAIYVLMDAKWWWAEQEYTFAPQKITPRLSIFNGLGPVTVTIREYGKPDSTQEITRPGFTGLEFETLLNAYYPVLQGILDKAKGITPYFTLNAQDVANYDPSIPIWLEQYQSYFYLNSINEYTGQGPTQCQLWRL